MLFINKNQKQNNTFTLLLILFSAIIYLIQIVLFKRHEDSAFYFFQDLAFVPLNAIIVTLVINSLLNRREKQKKIKKTNVIVCMFFVECGTLLISSILNYITNFNDFNQIIQIDNLNKKNIGLMKKKIKDYNINIDLTEESLEILHKILQGNKQLMISLLENSNLLEHDTFTDMLWATFHLSDELSSRESFKNLPPSDINHLSVDTVRAYKLLAVEWLDYMQYLNKEYPFLYSLAARKNPFADEKDTIIYS